MRRDSGGSCLKPNGRPNAALSLLGGPSVSGGASTRAARWSVPTEEPLTEVSTVEIGPVVAIPRSRGRPTVPSVPPLPCMRPRRR